MKPGKVFVEYEEFERAMRAAELHEQDFLRELQLGMYTVREWKRQQAVPFWAVKYLQVRANGTEKPNTQKLPVSFIWAQLTPQEDKEWTEADREGNQARADELYAIARARAVKLYGDNFDESPLEESGSLIG